MKTLSQNHILLITLFSLAILSVSITLILKYTVFSDEPTYKYLCVYHKDVMPEVKQMVTIGGIKNTDEYKNYPDFVKKIFFGDKQCAKITKDELKKFLNLSERRGMKLKIKWEDLKKSEKECNACKTLYFSCSSDNQCQSGDCVGGSQCAPPQ